MPKTKTEHQSTAENQNSRSLVLNMDVNTATPNFIRPVRDDTQKLDYFLQPHKSKLSVQNGLRPGLDCSGRAGKARTTGIHSKKSRNTANFPGMRDGHYPKCKYQLPPENDKDESKFSEPIQKPLSTPADNASGRRLHSQLKSRIRAKILSQLEDKLECLDLDGLVGGVNRYQIQVRVVPQTQGPTWRISQLELGSTRESCPNTPNPQLQRDALRREVSELWRRFRRKRAELDWLENDLSNRTRSGPRRRSENNIEATRPKWRPVRRNSRLQTIAKNREARLVNESLLSKRRNFFSGEIPNYTPDDRRMYGGQQARAENQCFTANFWKKLQ